MAYGKLGDSRDPQLAAEMPTTRKLTPLCKFLTPNSKFDPKPKTPQIATKLQRLFSQADSPHLISHDIETDREKRRKKARKKEGTQTARNGIGLAEKGLTPLFLLVGKIERS